MAVRNEIGVTIDVEIKIGSMYAPYVQSWREGDHILPVSVSEDADIYWVRDEPPLNKGDFEF